MKTLKDLNKNLTKKESGFNYTYEINNTLFEINEFNGQKGWCLNESRKVVKETQSENKYSLKNSYGYEGLTLRECKQMILMQWNNEGIK